MGDYNAVLALEDRVMGNPVVEADIRDFNQFLVDAAMTEMRTVWRDYTWTNGHVMSRIDRAIVNSDWMQQYPQLEASVLDPYFSDHSPLSTSLAPVWNKLKRVKLALKNLNNTAFAGVDTRVKIARQQLKDMQEKMRSMNTPSALFGAEKELRRQLEKWSTIEESVYKQKSRVQWLKLGDSNTAFFHASIKNRVSQNMIRSLVSTNGNVINTEKGIEDESIGFYRTLLGSSAKTLPAINLAVMKRRRILDRDKQLRLIAPVQAAEVLQALNGIDDQKAPGSDGFNSHFFKTA
ncbi:uncharacterized protein LOC132637995 [Lycium barbarum]|uniref:uncharacterized protein LOC132637995 n=1 Tax=Lycium barbarum TaxID=112863 RepID=UPI00293EE780|nr:uncharacterized protein LOC132637995 [Lycium barbarum]